MFINFNTEGINIYFLCPFASFFFLVGASYAAGYSYFGKNAYTQNIFVSFGEMLAIIPHLLSVKIDKNTYNNKSERASLNKDLNSSNTKKSLIIPLEYTNLEEEIKDISPYKILLLGFIDYLQSLCFFYGNYYTNYQIYFWSSHIFFLCLFTRCLLIKRLYRHQIISFIIFICLDLLHIIFVLLDDFIKLKKIIFIFLLISNICFSFELVFEKILMENNFISIYKLCFLIGLTTFIINLIVSILMTIIAHNVSEKPDFIFDFSEYFNEMSENIVMEIILIIIYMVLTGLYNIFQFLTIKRLSPNHALITQIMLAFYCSIMNLLLIDMEVVTSIISIVFHSLCIIVLLIFLEVIELKFCGIDQDTAHNISNRADMENNLRTLSVGSFNGSEVDENNNSRNESFSEREESIS